MTHPADSRAVQQTDSAVFCATDARPMLTTNRSPGAVVFQTEMCSDVTQRLYAAAKAVAEGNSDSKTAAEFGGYALPPELSRELFGAISAYERSRTVAGKEETT